VCGALLPADALTVDPSSRWSRAPLCDTGVPLDGPQLGNPKTAKVRHTRIDDQRSAPVVTLRRACYSNANADKQQHATSHGHRLQVFNENFFRDFRAALGKEHVVQKFELCDFGVRGAGGR
jgi:hypothetical protein